MIVLQTIGDDSKRSTLQETIPLIFDAIDTDKDQSITRKEFGNYFKSLNLTDDSAVDQIFNAMDSNSDGSINRDGKHFFFF
jgi:Ca2+-binding EF-hand superfamily protein